MKGKVQGVSYRASTFATAEEIGVNGFVKNMPDGSVFAEAEGCEDKLEKFIAWCRKGPRFARVDDLAVVEIELKGYKKFEIEY